MTRVRRWIYRVWYEGAGSGWVLLPLEVLFRLVVSIRCALYRLGIFRSGAAGAPVVVVGNIAVGGGGKTPLVGWLAERLTGKGISVAIVSRGYGGQEPTEPLRVTVETDPALSGDEAAMLARRSGVAVWVCRDRLAGARAAVRAGAQLVLTDDGLQHYRLQRDWEIVVVDADRGHGNGRCLPLGPLREPLRRLESVDQLIYAGQPKDALVPSYQLTLGTAVNLADQSVVPLADFSGQTVHAIAGIAHPRRFVDALAQLGINAELIDIADHGTATEAQLCPDGDQPVLMTEKDAVKYHSLEARHWMVPATVMVSDSDARTVLAPILKLIDIPAQRD